MPPYGGFGVLMKKLINEIKYFTDGVSAKNISAHSAACAFYMFVSLVPFVALAAAILPYTGLSQDSLLDFINSYIPSALSSIIENITYDIYFASGIILPITIVITVYLASRAFSSLIRGIENIYGVEKYTSYFNRVLRACLYTVGILAAMVIILLLNIFTSYIAELINDQLPFISPLIRLIIKLRFVFAAIILTVIFMMIYRWVPGRHMRFAEIFPGALAAALAWLLFTWLFSLLMILSGSRYDTYGSLATIVISLLWMYWCMYIILLGAYLNYYIQDRKTRRSEEYFGDVEQI